jgi:hypothetical protein
LQLRDELNVDWMRRWRAMVNKKIYSTNELTFTVHMPEKKHAK